MTPNTPGTGPWGTGADLFVQLLRGPVQEPLLLLQLALGALQLLLLPLLLLEGGAQLLVLLRQPGQAALRLVQARLQQPLGHQQLLLPVRGFPQRLLHLPALCLRGQGL